MEHLVVGPCAGEDDQRRFSREAYQVAYDAAQQGSPDAPSTGPQSEYTRMRVGPVVYDPGGSEVRCSRGGDIVGTLEAEAPMIHSLQRS